MTASVGPRCRYIPHTSFVSPEFTQQGDPLATVNLSTTWPWHDKGSDEERDVESEEEVRQAHLLALLACFPPPLVPGMFQLDDRDHSCRHNCLA